MLLKILLAITLCVVPDISFAQSRQYVIAGGVCDGGKLAARYSLSRGDFWMVGNTLVLKDGVAVADDPPVCEAPDSPIVVARNFAKSDIDSQKEIVLRAVASVLIDQVNLIRAGLPHALLSLTRSGTTVTATTPVAHGLNKGDVVSVFGADQAGYAGQQTVTASNSTQFTYTIGTTPATPATGSLLYVEGPIPGPTPQVTLQQAIAAIKNKIDSGDVDK